MEDAILGNSKGATYKSFILDVEIVIKKEGAVNVAEGRVKNKNTRNTKEVPQNPGKNDKSKKNMNKDTFIAAGGETNLREIIEKPKSEEFMVEKCIISRKRSSLSTFQQSVSIVGKTDSNYNKEHHKQNLSYERKFSDSTSQRHPKKKRTHKSAHSSKMYRGRVEPVDFLECNRIFMCNYLQLPRRNSDSALYCKYLGTLNKILQQEYIIDSLDKTLKNVRSTNEVFSLLKPCNIWKETSKNKLCSSIKDLGSIYSYGDYKTHNFGAEKERLWKLHQVLNINPDDNCKSSDENSKSAVECDEPHRSVLKYSSDSKLKYNISNKEVCMNTVVSKSGIKSKHSISNEEVSKNIVLREIVNKGSIKNKSFSKNTLAFFQRIRNMRSFLYPISQMKKQIFKKPYRSRKRN